MPCYRSARNHLYFSDSVNNFTPQFVLNPYYFDVSAFADGNTPVGTVNASDSDSSNFGEFTYTLDQTSLPGNYFKVGRIYTM